MRPVVLDIDDSVGPLEHSVMIPLQHWRDALRLACRPRLLRDFGKILEDLMPDDSGTVFIGSGDFHHLSLPLIERVSAQRGPLEVVVFDNHPDNMRYPFGVHCGSWVGCVTALPRVTHVHIVGITSADIGPGHAWEMQLQPLLRGRLTFWSIGASVSWTRALGIQRAFRNFSSAVDMLEAFCRYIANSSLPVYLSIDKDVLSVEDARTNWDQGCMREQQLYHAIEQLHGRIVGSDVTGEISVADYPQVWKRLLASIDRQPNVVAEELPIWQSHQHALNKRLLEATEDAYFRI